MGGFRRRNLQTKLLDWAGLSSTAIICWILCNNNTRCLWWGQFTFYHISEEAPQIFSCNLWHATTSKVCINGCAIKVPLKHGQFTVLAIAIEWRCLQCIIRLCRLWAQKVRRCVAVVGEIVTDSVHTHDEYCIAVWHGWGRATCRSQISTLTSITFKIWLKDDVYLYLLT